MIELPPGATARIGEGGSAFSLPLWFYWMEISQRQAEIAEANRSSDEMIDALSAALAGEERERPDESDRNAKDGTFAAMIAIAAAAFAIDALYGTVKPLIKPPESSAARERQILECLKVGFEIGPHAERWLKELDWLFEIRRNGVHHAEKLSPTIVVRVTSETAVLGGPETFSFTAEAARRAADFATELIETCMENPKPATAEWAEARRDTDNISG
jgi:hypothetical protein